ncbi:right-handed parallel beta-helix repeat-containing protein [Aquabacterium lacunae]|uniref:Right-handed parallel beta-helix repeat-containing protein n=1 Tax=Aquabacterium lacunae TaxID=2528630 RepID=A0A4Q9H050_9BURK|nr:right-handed parallel beta-helix repeat-containing protein [Aquabacterium lacunae]TBO27928.1 right-handed parallel beta-helix repeat-containing protein [Aquabacterium lacunae]
MKHVRQPLWAAAVACLALWGSPLAWAATWEIRPDCAPGAPRCLNHPQRLTQWQSVAPGDEVLIHPSGTEAGWVSQLGGATVLHIENAQGTAQAPIVVRGVGLPKLVHGANLTRSGHVVLQDLDITEQRRGPDGSGRPALTLQGGTRHVQIFNSHVHHATGSGVHVSADAGAFLRVGPGNRITQNGQHGVAVSAPGFDRALPAPAVSSEITGNQIVGNGLHGVELSGSYWRVSQNQVLQNGWSQGGTSGIHLFSRTDTPGALDCDRNEVVYNTVALQIDRTAYDGNGLQVDHFCDHNILAFNVAWLNDGAGLSVVAARGNVVAHNTLVANAQDVNRANSPALRAELILASWPDFCWNPHVDAASCRLPTGRASDNLVIGNLLQATQPGVPAVWVNDDAADPVRNRNKFGPNLLGHVAGGPLLNWAAAQASDARGVDLLTQGSADAGVALAEHVAFVDAANPMPPRHGLRLQAMPSRVGWGPLSNLPDAAGVLPAKGMSGWGAYYFAPR